VKPLKQGVRVRANELVFSIAVLSLCAACTNEPVVDKCPLIEPGLHVQTISVWRTRVFVSGAGGKLSMIDGRALPARPSSSYDAINEEMLSKFGETKVAGMYQRYLRGEVITSPIVFSGSPSPALMAGAIVDSSDQFAVPKSITVLSTTEKSNDRILTVDGGVISLA
jgi:hypothetical protein